MIDTPAADRRKGDSATGSWGDRRLDQSMKTGSWGVQDRGTRVTDSTVASVLVVDDDAPKRLALKAALAPLGLPIVEVDSGQGALRLLMEQDFAVILLDVRMPDMDGFETAALIRRRKESEMTPIIFITAFAGDEIGPKSKYVSGAVDFMFAPIHPDELRAKVSVFVNLYLQAASFAARADEVQASADHLRLLTDSAPIGIFRTNAEKRFVYTNPRWTEISGVSWQDALGRDWATIIASPHSPGVTFDDSSIGSGITPLGQRYELALSDGTSKVVLATSEPIHDHNGALSGWVGTLADVTAETRAEQERSRFESLVQNSRDVIVVLDGEGRCTYASPAVFEVTGFLPQELIGSVGIDSLHPDDGKRMLDHLAEMAGSSDSRKTIEVRRRTKSAGWIWIEIRVASRLDDPSIQGVVLNYHDITERRASVERLAQSEKLLADGQALSHLGSFTFDVRTKKETWSDEQYRLLGFEPGSVVASFETLLTRVHHEDRAELSRVTDESVETGAPFDLDYRVVLPDGAIRWIHVRGEYATEDGVPVWLMGMSHDITELRESTDLLAQREKLLVDGQALSHLGSFTWDMRTNEVSWSDEQYRLFGFEPGSVIPTLDTFLEKIHPDDLEMVSAATAASRETGVAFEAEFRVVPRKGVVRWISEKGEVQFEAGVPAVMTGMSQDITSRHEAEEERLVLLEQQKDLADRLRLLLDSTGEGIYGVDAHGVCTFMNTTGANLLGGPPAHFVGKSMHALIHHTHADGSDYPESECPIVEGIRMGERTISRSEPFWRLDGSSFPADYSSHPIAGVGEGHGAVIAFQDVTVRLEMEEELRQSEKLFRGAFDAAQTGIALIAADGLTYVDVNQALWEMLGYTKAELLQLNWHQITHPDDLELNRERFSELRAGQQRMEQVTKRYVRKDGQGIQVEVSDSVVRGADGSPIYFVAHVNNVTERKRAADEKERLEGDLVQAQKMEAVGQLAGGVAHDFNNILSVILNYAQFASEGLDPDDERLGDIQEISKAGDKAANLVHQLLAFSRKEVIEARVIDLNEVVIGIHQILSRSLGEDIDLSFDPGDNLPLVLADPGRIEQVLLNLAVNARDAMVDGGTLQIRTSSVRMEEEAGAALPPGDYSVVTVSDSGAGMDEGTAARIFEPFFTTKPRGEGTGMGLSSAYGILEQAGGCLSVESKLGVGTTFTLHLPAVGAVLPQSRPKEEKQSVGGSETILLVEDEDAVRELVLRILRKKGYEVVPYSSGAEALEYCRSHIDTIDLLLTDVVMPKMSGRELSDRASSICMGLKTLFMSGYTDALIAQRGVLASNEHLINKPFKPDSLLATVRSLLDVEVAA